MNPHVQSGAAEAQPKRLPGFDDLRARLVFSSSDGRIRLGDQRMLLIHAKALGNLRREMVETLGLEVARGFITRMGYYAGAQDARMARSLRTGASLQEMFLAGPQMHCLEGVGLSQLVRLDFDVASGRHYGEFVWTSPVEDEEHLRHFAIGTEPACWMQIGYASGYATEFMGLPVLYREVECQAMGQPWCRIVGKPIAEWGSDACEDLRHLAYHPLEASAGAVAVPPALRCPAAPAASEAGESVGISPGFNAAMHMVHKVAPTQATVLFLGESGVGKEVFARTLHRLSTRREAPFVALNCAAIPDNLIESELFGVERGAFTGVQQSRPGRFERAEGGTLFLDEVGTLTAEAQSKLLRVIQEREVERLGDTRTRKVDVRLVAATNLDLRDAVARGTFREDLYFRLNVFPIRILPLRERREDIPLLMAHFLVMFNQRHGRRLSGFTQHAVDAMLSYDWPGNVRELENVVERGVILAADDTAIDTPHLFTSGEVVHTPHFSLDAYGRLVDRRTAEAPGEADHASVERRIVQLLRGEGGHEGGVSLDDIETLLLRRAIEQTHGNVSAAARVLGITRPQMVYRLKARGIAEAGTT